uniref:Glycosyltransferase family 92 protein n=1 Tax=Oryza punctata TaxID=4537 RepID=A0A0E0LFW7_ORYPU
MQARRRHARHCRLVVAALIIVTTLLFLTGDAPGVFIDAPTRNLLVPPRRLPLSLGAVREATRADAVLLPDWEVLLLLRPNATAIAHNATCVFRGGASSPARSLGTLPSSGRYAYTCAMPEPARRHQPFHAPRISPAAVDAVHVSPQHGELAMMVRWSGRLVYDSVVLDGGDVLVFAKGVNPRQGVNRPASDVRCVYYRGGSADDVVASLPAATSAQQVFRCPPPTVDHPPAMLRVTLGLAGEEEAIPSVATYSPPARGASHKRRHKICACTMVRDVGKFLREWVSYHAAVGVERFILYDNGSEDDLSEQVRRLTAEGLDVTTLAWPWPKTQEAGFSHSAAVHREACEWMAFIDVDEFIFSPEWAASGSPSRSMLRSIVGVEAEVGQVSLGCVDFGPSGRSSHPAEGVTQGYTCRRRAVERHKSVVRVEAVDRSLVNSVHHFALREGKRSEWSRRARVNHYKFQAWEEFRVKFRRRVSAYVPDWTSRLNLQSKDRTPGLGFDPVQPPGWASKFCDLNDTLLRDVTRRWRRFES